ncbi:MAG: beta tubulin [Alphaproteobacteria bacterium HGW-Alphaproteobacteria-5]|nr:MAG: beta tubulin [Alphaproteobacteria bacterium HGW-Alphaproteobacteria-5]
MTEAAYQAALLTGSTTRARAWRLTRRDGVVLAFTDHDRPLAFLGATFEPRAALTASDAAASLGLGVDDQDAAGALSSAAITEADIDRGLYDGATVEVWDVLWTDPEARRLVGLYTLGEIERGDLAFRAELRSRAGGLDKKEGRAYLATCDRVLGDAKCGVDLTPATFTGSGEVVAVRGVALEVLGLDSYPSGWFARGVLTWETGANAGRKSGVRLFVPGPDGRQALGLWESPPDAAAPGDLFTVTAGCDKTWATCRAKFANGDNFRGFPFMPGESFPFAYPTPGDPDLDGGSLFSDTL